MSGTTRRVDMVSGCPRDTLRIVEKYEKAGYTSLENYIKLYTMKQSLRHMSSIQHIIKKQWCDTNHMVVDDISEG